jgi:hypothetical protein
LTVETLSKVKIEQGTVPDRQSGGGAPDDLLQIVLLRDLLWLASRGHDFLE